MMILHEDLSLLGSELLLVDCHELLFIDAWWIQDVSRYHVTVGLRKRTLRHTWGI